MAQKYRRSSIRVNVPNSNQVMKTYQQGVSSFAGIRTTTTPIEMPLEYLAEAENVYLDNDYVLSTRKRIEPTSVYNAHQVFHSVYLDGNVWAIVADGPNARKLVNITQSQFYNVPLTDKSRLFVIDKRIFITRCSDNKFGVWVIKKGENDEYKPFNFLDDDTVYIPEVHLDDNGHIITSVEGYSGLNILSDKVKMAQENVQFNPTAIAAQTVPTDLRNIKQTYVTDITDEMTEYETGTYSELNADRYYVDGSYYFVVINGKVDETIIDKSGYREYTFSAILSLYSTSKSFLDSSAQLIYTETKIFGPVEDRNRTTQLYFAYAYIIDRNHFVVSLYARTGAATSAKIIVEDWYNVTLTQTGTGYTATWTIADGTTHPYYAYNWFESVDGRLYGYRRNLDNNKQYQNVTISAVHVDNGVFVFDEDLDTRTDYIETINTYKIRDGKLYYSVDAGESRRRNLIYSIEYDETGGGYESNWYGLPQDDVDYKFGSVSDFDFDEDGNLYAWFNNKSTDTGNIRTSVLYKVNTPEPGQEDIPDPDLIMNLTPLRQENDPDYRVKVIQQTYIVEDEDETDDEITLTIFVCRLNDSVIAIKSQTMCSLYSINTTLCEYVHQQEEFTRYIGASSVPAPELHFTFYDKKLSIPLFMTSTDDVYNTQYYHYGEATFTLSEAFGSEYYTWFAARKKLGYIDAVYAMNNFLIFVGNESYAYSSAFDNTFIRSQNIEHLLNAGEDITDLMVISPTAAIMFTDFTTYWLTGNGEGTLNSVLPIMSQFEVPHVKFGSCVKLALTDVPTVLTERGILAFTDSSEVTETSKNLATMTDVILTKFRQFYSSSADVLVYRDEWLNFYGQVNNASKSTELLIYDNRNQTWWSWSLPIAVKAFYKEDKELYCVDVTGTIYHLTDEVIVNTTNHAYYYDEIISYKNVSGTNQFVHEKLGITWLVQSHPTSLGVASKAKSLEDVILYWAPELDISRNQLDDIVTQFADLNIHFTVSSYERPSIRDASKFNIEERIHQLSIGKVRTFIPKFNYVAYRLTNYDRKTDVMKFDKLKLSGLTFEYKVTNKI